MAKDCLWSANTWKILWIYLAVFVTGLNWSGRFLGPPRSVVFCRWAVARMSLYSRSNQQGLPVNTDNGISLRWAGHWPRRERDRTREVGRGRERQNERWGERDTGMYCIRLMFNSMFAQRYSSSPHRCLHCHFVLCQYLQTYFMSIKICFWTVRDTHTHTERERKEGETKIEK